jgi:hypothetical protein
MKTVELKWIEDDNHTVAKDACDTLQGLIDGGAFPDLVVKCEDDTLYITGEKEVLDRAVMKIQKAFAKYGQIMMKEAKNGTTEELRIESFDDNVQDIFNHTLAEYETFKENTKEERPNTYITTLGKFQYKFNKLKEAAAKKDKKILQNILMEIDELTESYEEVKFKPMNKLDEGKLIDSVAIMVFHQLASCGYKNAAYDIIMNNIDYINDHSNDNPSELTEKVFKRWQRQQKRKNKEYEKLNNESYEEINEDSLDDFDDTEIKKSINAQSDEIKQFVQIQRSNLWNYANEKMDSLCEKCNCKRKYDDMYFNDWGFSGRKPGASLSVQIKIPYAMYKTLTDKDFADWFYGDENCPFIPEHKHVSIYTRDMAPEVMIDFKIPEYVEKKKERKPRKPRDPNKGYKKPDYINPDMKGGTYFDGDTQVYEMPEENESFNEDYNFYRNRYRQMAEKRKRASEEKKRNLSKETFGKKFLELAQTYAGVEGLDIEVAYDKLMSDNRVFELVDSTMSIEDIMDKISAGELLQ